MSQWPPIRKQAPSSSSSSSSSVATTSSSLTTTTTTSQPSAASRLQSKWTVQNDAQVALLEQRLKAAQLQNARLEKRLEEMLLMEEQRDDAHAMLWNLSRQLLTTQDIFGNPIVRLPHIAEAMAGIPLGSLGLDAKLDIGRVVARLPEFQHVTGTYIKKDETLASTSSSNTMHINRYTPEDLPQLLPILFNWMNNQPFTIFKDPHKLLMQELNSHLIPDLAQLVVGYL